MLRGRKLLNIPQTSLELRCDRRLQTWIGFGLIISGVDEGVLCQRPLYGDLQTSDACAPH